MSATTETRQRIGARHATIDAMPSPTTVTRYVLTPIEPDHADRLRARWAGSGATPYVADQQPGYPCRQCLRDAVVGEELILVSYDPFTADSPYRSASPIFLHREPCSPPADRTALPTQLTVRQLSVRAFDAGAMMIDAAVVDGADLDATLQRLFSDPGCDHVHVHNATRGCWAVRVDRA